MDNQRLSAKTDFIYTGNQRLYFKTGNQRLFVKTGDQGLNIVLL